MKYLISFICSALLTSTIVFGQAASYFDPAQAYLRLLLEKGHEGSQQQIGNFKVVGTSNLYGGNHVGNVYFKNWHVKHALLTYDTYKQVVAINVGQDDKSLIKEVNELDSFILKAGEKTDFKSDLKFINVAQFDSSKKFFLQIVSMGPRFNLYKAYKTELGYVSTNYIQSELRQFDLNFEYFYTDSQKTGLRKLKIAPGAVKKEFKSIKDIKDISSITDSDEYNYNIELSMIRIFSVLNN